MNEFANLIYHVIHLAVIIINCVFGFIPGRCQRLFILTYTTTIVSWLGFGLQYGLGYCFLTDWHWQLKRDMGEHNLPPSYIHYISETWLNLDLSRGAIDMGVAMIFIALLLVYIVNIKNVIISKSW